MQPRTRGYLLAASSAIVWALTGPGIKYLLDVHHVPELALAFWRTAFIALLCLPTLWLLRPTLVRVGRRDLLNFALVGSISIGVYHALWVASIALNGAAVASVLIYTFPVFVTLGDWLLDRTPLRRPQLAALALALLGCALLVRVYDPEVLRVSWLGILIGAATAITHAGYVLFNDRAVQSHSPLTSLAYTMLFGSLVLLGLNLLFAPGKLLAIGSAPEPWLLLLGLALGPTLGGYALFMIALRYVPAQAASLISIIEAPTATLVAVVLLGEQLEWPQLLGVALILGAVSLPYVWGQNQAPRAENQEAPAEQPAIVGEAT